MSTDQLSFLKPPIPSEIAPVGTLQDMPSYALLLWVAQHEFTGRLILERDRRVKHLFFSKGEITSIRSNLIMEGIDMILKRGYLDPQYVVQIQQDVVSGTLDEDWEDRMVLHLLNKEHLPKEKLKEVLDIQIFEQFLNALGWIEGKYFLKPMDEVPERHAFHKSRITLQMVFKSLDMFLKSGQFNLLPANMSKPHLPYGEVNSLGGGTLLLQLSNKKTDGKLSLKRGRKRKNILYKSGKIYSVSTSDPKETLEMVLERWRFLPKDIIKSVATQARVSGTKLRIAILNQKLLSEGELKEALKLLHIERILETFSWRSGYYEWFSFPSHETIQEEEKTSAESSKNFQNYCELALEIARQNHKPHILFFETEPLSQTQRETLFYDFNEYDPSYIKIICTNTENDKPTDIIGVDPQSISPNEPIFLNPVFLKERPDEEQERWIFNLLASGRKTLWVADISLHQHKLAEYFCSFLLIHPSLLNKKNFESFYKKHSTLKAQGYFMMETYSKNAESSRIN